MISAALRLVVKGVRASFNFGSTDVLSPPTDSCIYFPQANSNFYLFAMSEDHGPNPPPEASVSRETTARESSTQPRDGLCRALRKFKKNINKKVSKRFKRSRPQILAVQNADHESASSNQNIEDVLRLHPSDDDQPTTSKNLSTSGCVNQGASGEPASKILNTPGVEEIPDSQSVGAELRGARGGWEGTRLLGGHVTSVVSKVEDGPKDLATADDFQTTYLQPLKIFNTVIENLTNVHPYAKMALGVLSAASKIILAQTERDQSVQSLLEKLEQLYCFMSQEDTLAQISSQLSIAGRIAQQTLECARFIRDYSEKKSFWKRLGKNVASETDDLIKRYNNALDGLMQQFRDQALRDIADLVRCASDELGDKLILSDMPYAAAAGLDTTKQCLPGTRMAILSQITEWINDSRDTAQRVMWLSGPAGTGKSAIAHTIANWFNDSGGLGSCFCFDRRSGADERHKKVFSTIARDLADRDPEIRRALANAVEHAKALKSTTDIIQQWRKLFMEPLKKFSGSSVGPVLIVIEALDESGGAETRRNLLRILAGTLEGEGLPQITELPSNFRILITSRALPDISSEFQDAPHIRRLSMDDISEKDSKRDIRTFVSHELKKVSGLGDKEFGDLADKAWWTIRMGASCMRIHPKTLCWLISNRTL
ncbi:uncharacterized protein EDB93DRAFT_1327918 [Suillus bovinus]|uniref:uncharacterized protein n=1 Tax=Suillus bovinus TaxID=48563 RepID=UPI001B86AF8D|nr:uncharacterized protein EDB93DRAFT_1327918 [Suillus bovinus]KAG2150643.1 hypothetical protein EDB93DRAFT_1327918 [Suillus bovinus]